MDINANNISNTTNAKEDKLPNLFKTSDNKDSDEYKIKVEEELDNIYKNNLQEHAHFIHNFDKSKFNYSKIIEKYLTYDNIFNENYFPVITRVDVENNKIVIQRKRIYKDFFSNFLDINKFELSEKIVIDDNKGLIAFNNDMFKKEGVLITNESIIHKNVKFKVYSSPKQLLFFQNAYYYNNIKNLSYMYQHIFEEKDRNKIEINNVFNLKYYDLIKNLI